MLLRRRRYIMLMMRSISDVFRNRKILIRAKRLALKISSRAMMRMLTQTIKHQEYYTFI